jgi:hypothetical protein
MTIAGEAVVVVAVFVAVAVRFDVAVVVLVDLVGVVPAVVIVSSPDGSGGAEVVVSDAVESSSVEVAVMVEGRSPWSLWRSSSTALDLSPAGIISGLT